MKIIIVGAGNTLYFLCRTFATQGHDVVIINRNHNECVQFARQLKATVICGEGSDVAVLEEAGARRADTVLAVTPNDHDNLIICQLASLEYEVPKTLALANDPDNAKIFQKLGVTAFSTTEIIGKLIEQKAAIEQITNLFPVGEGRVIVTELILDEKSPAIGALLKDIALPAEALVAVIIRDDHPTIPHGGSDLLANDKLVLMTLPENHGTVLRLFTGE